ncbi:MULTISPECIES: winged helix-turn-helix transcriptional regulator [Rhizobium]|uniref:winged helix-turn-helix transcriptional regulator n=1 Tax=Rhizobium TaxID=379 RepID=UPI00056ADDA1|nr:MULTISPECIES: helix-turn-helix domain-containing protein [Rhizobium]NRP89125.1 putative HTH-type transcriptional regulator YybR [Ensifer adhaerens]NTJ09132.1 helix-turn-helix transcriptional regulator [Rhizobium lusitanum]
MKGQEPATPRALEGWGLIKRYDYATIPPKTEYSLTQLGRTLRPLMEAMAAWGDETQELITEANDTEIEFTEPSQVR